jgi:hypothetical protein
MKRTISWALGLIAAYVVIRNIPDFVRYVRIARM